jgi:prevent-host-death family protein
VQKTTTKGAEEARNELPSLIEDAQSGRTTIITRRGRPVAALVPLGDYRNGRPQHSLLRLEGSGRGLWGKNSARVLEKLRDEWNR